MIKCIRCKTVFNQSDTHIRLCNNCRHNKNMEQRKRAHEKRQKEREAKRKERIKIKTCPICNKKFEANHAKRVYCNNPCYYSRIAKVPLQIERAEKNIINIDKRIIKANELYEEKMNKLQQQLDYINLNLEKQKTKLTTRLEYLNSIAKK